jgi:hypothetical protein
MSISGMKQGLSNRKGKGRQDGKQTMQVFVTGIQNPSPYGEAFR